MYEKIRCQSKLIQFEVKAYIHKNHMSIQEMSILIPIEKNSMIPIETTIISNVYLILPILPIMFKLKMISTMKHT